MLKVNNTNTRGDDIDTILVFLFVTLNKFHKFFSKFLLLTLNKSMLAAYCFCALEPSNGFCEPTSFQFSILIPPENIRKSKASGFFMWVKKEHRK